MHLLRSTTLRTPESIELDFTLAGLGNRALALGLDYAILSMGLSFLLFLISLATEPVATALAQLNLDTQTLWLWGGAIALLVFFTLYAGYFAIFEALWQGQTLGKRWVKIRVIQDNGRPVGLAQSALRTLLRPIDDLLMLGVCFIAFSKTEKRIGDWVAGTLVIQEEETVLAPITLSPDSQTIANQLASEIDPNLLTPSEFAMLVNYLQRRSQLSPKATVQVSRQLVSQVQERIGLDALPSSVSDEAFLEALYRIVQHEPSKLLE